MLTSLLIQHFNLFNGHAGEYFNPIVGKLRKGVVPQGLAEWAKQLLGRFNQLN